MKPTLLSCLFFLNLTCASALYAEETAQGAIPIEAQGAIQLDQSEALKIALEKNLDLRAAREQIERAHGVKLEVRSGLLPRLVGSAQVSKVDKDTISSFNGNQFGSEKDWNAGVELNQNLFAFGKYWNSYKKSSFEEQAARLEMQSVLQDVVFSVKEKFFDVLLAREQVEVQAELLALQQEELGSETKKRDAGTVSDFNVLRAEVAVANSKTPLIRAENNARLSLEELSRVLGIGSEVKSTQVLELKGELGFDPYVTTQEAVLETALLKRPELARLKLLVEAQKRGVRVAQSGYLPELSVYAGYSAQKVPFSDNFSDELHGWKMGARASWNIFDSFGTAGKVGQASSDLNSAMIALQRANLDISVEARRTYSSFVEAKELVAASKKTAEQGRESLRLAKARLDVGATTQLDVLDAQVALRQARTNEVLALHDYAVSVERLKRAMGELAQEGEVEVRK